MTYFAAIKWFPGAPESVKAARQLFVLARQANLFPTDTNGHPLREFDPSAGEFLARMGREEREPGKAVLPGSREFTWSPLRPAEIRKASMAYEYYRSLGFAIVDEAGEPVDRFDATAAYFYAINPQQTTINQEEENMGDKTITWSPDDKAECDRAEAEFDVLEAAGFNMLVNGKGVTKFDRKAGSFLATKAPITGKANLAETEEDKAQDAANASAAKAKPKAKPKAKAKAKAKPAAQQPDENQAASQADDKETDANA